MSNTLFRAYMFIGFFYFLSDLQAQDQNAADSLIKIYQNEELSEEEKKSVLLDIAFYSTNPDESIKYANILIEDAEKDSSFLWLHRSLVQKGLAYKIKGDLDKALECYYKSLKYVKKINYPLGIAAIYNAIGSVYRMQNNYENAIDHYNVAVEIFREQQDTLMLASCLLNMGELYRLHNDLDSALTYFDESRVLFDDIKYTSGIAYNKGNIGLVYGQLGKYDSAEVNLKEAIEILEEQSDHYPICVYNISMAGIYKEKNEYQRAIAYAGSSYKVAIREGFIEQVRDASLKLAELNSDIGNYKEAYEYQNQYIIYRDSLVNEETIRKMADQRTEYEVSQKQIQVDLLETEKKTQQIIAIALGMGILLISALAFLFYKNNQERKRANMMLSEQKKEIEAQRDQLDTLNKTKDRFFSIISHDLRGPVHAFKGMSRLIRVLVAEKNVKELEEINQHFDESIDRLSNLLDGLLDWAMSQQGEIPYHPEKIEVAGLSENLIELFKNMARAKNIKLTADVYPALFIRADINSMNTILRNLINNALKFTPEEGSIALSARQVDREVAIRVSDTGVGIPKDKLKDIFRLSEDKRSWGTAGEKGLGLGLQLVKQFSAMNGGRITVESREGGGTTFTVFVPVYTDAT